LQGSSNYKGILKNSSSSGIGQANDGEQHHGGHLHGDALFTAYSHGLEKPMV